jgi:hypothetical protein
LKSKLHAIEKQKKGGHKSYKQEIYAYLANLRFWEFVGIVEMGAHSWASRYQ